MLRRQALILITTVPFSYGCKEDIQNLDDNTLEGAKLALSVVHYVGVKYGNKLYRIPENTTKVVGVCLLILTTASFLLINYIEEELNERWLKIEIAEEVRIQLEEQQFVTLEKSDGTTEKRQLMENVYDDPTEVE